jgi:four helix bundle protein
MPSIFTFRDLEAWQKGMNLVEACYRVTTSFPSSELYGLSSLLRRAGVSIPSNLAEGHCRRSTGAYLNHVSIALGSHGELQTCVELSIRLGFLAASERARLIADSDTVGRLLYGLYNSLERKNTRKGS